MSPFEIINSFREELETKVNQTIHLASHSPLGGNEEWDVYMKSHELIPKTTDERKQLLALKETASKGALPVEVRMLLEKHQQSATGKLQELKQQFDKEEWWVRVETPAQKLIHNFIEEGIKKYMGETDAKLVSAKSIFSNALRTTPKYMTEIHKAGTKSEKCPTCHAARPADSELKTCAFCGSPIFNA